MKATRVIIIGVGNFTPAGEKMLEDSSHRATWPHLGILIVGSVIQQLGWDVALYDENVQGPIPLEKYVREGDIVGLSVVVTAADRSLALAKEAKGLGTSFVFMGNDQASARAKQILETIPEVDGVFRGDSLDSVRTVFQSILMTDSLLPERVSGFCRRRNGEIENPPPVPFRDISEFPTPAFSLYPSEYWNLVWENHRRTNGFEYADTAKIRGCNILLASGCPHGHDACSYCSIGEVEQLRWGNDEYYRTLLVAYQSFGINSFYNVCDDFAGFGAIIKKLFNLGIRFPHLVCYARAWVGAHCRKNIEDLLSLVAPGGHLKLNIGLDSGDDGVLKFGVNKGNGVQENKAMVLLMKELGIWGHFSFIFGSPGETKETCQRTLDFIQWTFDTLGRLVANCESDIYWISHGAPCEKIFTNYEYALRLATIARKTIMKAEWEQEFFSKCDCISVPWSVQEAWYRYFTNIDIAYAEECNARVRRLAQEHHTAFGRSYGGGVIQLKP